MGAVIDPGVQVRPARPSDVEGLVALMDGVIRWLVERGRSGQWGDTPLSSSPEFTDRVHALVDRGAVRIALRGAKVVGALVTSTDPPGYVPEAAIPEDALYVLQVTTDRGADGRGVGRVLMDEVDEIARADGMRFAALDHWAGSPELSQLYERAGYEEVGTFTMDQRDEPWTGIIRVREVPPTKA